MKARGRLQQRKWYYTILIVLVIFVAFSLFTRRSLHVVPTSPRSSLGRQAFEAAYQRANSSTAPQDDAEAVKQAYFEPGVWSPLSLNPAPLVQLNVKACLWPPSIWDACTIESTPREDAIQGPWVRVDRDLDRRVGVYYNYLFYRRQQPNSSLPPVVGIQLLTEDEAKVPETKDKLMTEGWRMAENDVRAGIWPRQPRLDLWYLARNDSPQEAFTELDVIYGNAGVLDGWERVSTVTNSTGKTAVRLVGRRKPKAPSSKPELRFSIDGSFRILQLADFHFSTENGKCRDTVNATACPPDRDADESSMVFLERAIDQARPDLIVLSGDQINGQGTSWSATSAILKVARIFENRAIPWAAIFGNHDGEDTDATKAEQMTLMQSLPYFVGEAGPNDVAGVGNYVLRLLSADPTRSSLFSLYLLDSHAYANSLFTSAYDYIKDSQIAWFKQQADNTTMILRPYRPPSLDSEKGMFDIGDHLAKRRLRGRRRIELKRQFDGQTLRKPNALAFWHIPLPEADDPIDVDNVTKAPLSIGEAIETSGGGPKHNSHFFDALLDNTELGSRVNVRPHAGAGLSLQDAMEAVRKAPPEVKIIAHGHQHVRASCERRKGIWMCFAGGSTYSGYGRTNFDRRVRIFDVSEYGEKVETFQLVDSSSSPDLSSLPEGGIGGSHTAGDEAQLEEEVLEELEAEGWTPVPDDGTENSGLGEAPVRKRQSAVRLKEVDRAVLVGPDALGT